MRKLVSALTLLVMFAIMMIPLPAQADTGCVISVAEIKVCGELLDQPLPEVVKVTVTAPPLPGPTVVVPGPTKTVQGPTETRTIYRQGPERRIFIAGPTVTQRVVVTKTPQAAPTKTVTKAPAESTVTVSPSRQVDTRRDTVLSERDEEDAIDLPSVSKPEAVGVGALVILGLVALSVLTLWAGYILGYKDADRENANFLSALRDKFYYRGKHS